MLFSSSLLLLAAQALAAPAGHVLHEKRSFLSPRWEKQEQLPPNALLPMRIGLVQNNLDKGSAMLMDISDHQSPNYAKHLSVEEVHDLFAPSQESVDAVTSWLHSAGIAPHRVSQSVNKQWIQFDAMASEAEALLKTQYHAFEHKGHGKKTIACDEYHVPAALAKHIDYITPGINLFIAGPKTGVSHLSKRTFRSSGSQPLPPLFQALTVPLEQLLNLLLSQLCRVAIVPLCISTMYKIPKGTKATPGNELGIFESLGDVYSQTDLNLFFLTLQPRIPQGTHPKLDAIDGAVAPVPVTQAGGESDLDFQISYPIIWPQNSILFQTDDPVYQANYTYQGFLNNFLNAIDGSYCTADGGISPLDPAYPNPSNETGAYKGQLQCGVYKPTNVISISYGGPEFDLPVSYQRRQCNEFMKLGLQGVTSIVASGDAGVGFADGTCQGANNKVFAPDFPSTCPYLLTVGSTVLPPTGDVDKDEEISTTRFPSGGGFSDIYARPDYQSSAVSNYFAVDNPPYASYNTTDAQAVGANGGIYNRAGRGYPDVSAVGDNVVVFVQGQPGLIGGTSASAPVWGAIITRINEERLAVGKKPVGFINPTLYAHPEALHDITNGSNPNCGTQGFSASKGWDPVSGLGTPIYPKLLDIFLSLA